MEKDLLQAVVKVESEIQQSIESERRKAAEWLESVRIAQSRELEMKKRQLEEEYSASLEKTCRECEVQAKKEIADVNQMTELLESLPDVVLQDIVKDFIQEILPAENK